MLLHQRELSLNYIDLQFLICLIADAPVRGEALFWLPSDVHRDSLP